MDEQRWCQVQVNGQVMRTPPEHPFWVQDQGWRAAGDLRPGELFGLLRWLLGGGRGGPPGRRPSLVGTELERPIPSKTGSGSVAYLASRYSRCISLVVSVTRSAAWIKAST